ncbi:Gfo/Idh/MocA family protein [Horticoccus sp. 23ND18S-11]|uniref:Gfo/Idh/MocA family protein n=1 Tax=Horticoccus sp. 23ND18S-11 TaxID=3391832 RepID=UPI0039C95F37
MNRRRFLTHSAGVVAAGSMLPSISLAATPPVAGKAASLAYVPRPKPTPVVKPGEFVFAAAHFDHGHITGQCTALIEAGGTLKWAYEPDEKKRAAFVARFKTVKVARSLDEILADPEVKLVAAAAVTSERGALGCRVMEAGKDYFTDKAPFTTLDQLAQARAVTARTGRKYMVYYSERLTSEAGMFATDLVHDGVIGRVVQVTGLGPHRLNKPTRPQWFFERAKYGGILCDIGSHQCEQFLTYTGAKDAIVTHAAVGNFANPETPELEDFGEASFVGDNGSTNQFRVDWFTPAGLSTWGDGRTFILGTKGYIELRKYVDVAREKTGEHVYLVDGKGEHHLAVDGRVGSRFFGEFILDCLNRTEKAMTQAHAFKAAELCLRAQASARRLT